MIQSTDYYRNVNMDKILYLLSDWDKKYCMDDTSRKCNSDAVVSLVYMI